MTTEAKKEAKPSHNFTDIVNDAIKAHGSPLLKCLTKDEPLVQSFHYRPGKGFIKVGSVLTNGRSVPCYRKGIMWLRGEVKEHIDSLPKAQMAELSATVMEILTDELTEGQNQKQVLLQAFNRKLQDDINAAVEKAGHEPFAFEQDYVNSAGVDSKVFVLMSYDGHMIEDERLDEIEANNQQKKLKRMQDATKPTADARSGSATYATA